MKAACGMLSDYITCKSMNMSNEQDEILNRISRAVYGNGRPGLLDRISKIETEMESLKAFCENDVRNIHLKLEKIEKFQIEEQTKQKLEKRKSDNGKWLIGLYVTSVLHILAAIVTIFVNLVN
jgi:hypothetical protein